MTAKAYVYLHENYRTAERRNPPLLVTDWETSFFTFFTHSLIFQLKFPLPPLLPVCSKPYPFLLSPPPFPFRKKAGPSGKGTTTCNKTGPTFHINAGWGTPVGGKGPQKSQRQPPFPLLGVPQDQACTTVTDTQRTRCQTRPGSWLIIGAVFVSPCEPRQETSF